VFPFDFCSPGGVAVVVVQEPPETLNVQTSDGTMSTCPEKRFLVRLATS
jgi:hypothetical protein